MIFLKEKDVVLTNDFWGIAVDFDLSSTIWEDLLTAEEQKKGINVYI